MQYLNCSDLDQQTHSETGEKYIIFIQIGVANKKMYIIFVQSVI